MKKLGLALVMATAAMLFFAVLPPMAPTIFMGVAPDGGFSNSMPPEALISSVPPLTVSVQTLGGKILPSDRFLQFTAVSLRISAAGVGGSTDAIFRVTDGTNTCDCTFACNAVAGNKRASCVSGGGSGCLFSTNADITYSWASAGNCVTPPAVLGNVDVNGVWQ